MTGYLRPLCKLEGKMTNDFVQLIKTYYQAFNAQDMDTFFSLLTEDVVHEINQGNTEIGKQTFIQFMKEMNQYYQEEVVDLVVFSSKDSDRVAAEFYIEGKYLATCAGLPEARGQRYRLRVGAFFTIHEGKICRVTNYYNMKEWLAQVK